MQKCCAFDLIVNTSVAFSLVGCFCEFVFIVAPKRWTLTKVGFMVWQRWGNGHGDWDMCNKFGKILYGAAIFGIGVGMISLCVLIALQEMKLFGVGCKM